MSFSAAAPASSTLGFFSFVTSGSLVALAPRASSSLGVSSFAGGITERTGESKSDITFISEKILHIDFYQVSLTKVIKIKVPVTAIGEPVGVKQDGGTLEHIMWEIEVECLPTKMPENVKIDVSNLRIGDSISAKPLLSSVGL